MSRKTYEQTDTSPTAPVKGSDFFPPGAGWNTAKKPSQSEDAPEHPGDRPAERQQKH